MDNSHEAILTNAHPSLVKSRQACLSRTISETTHNGGDGWLSDGTIFHQNVAKEETVDWAKLDSSLHTATFGAQSNGLGSIYLNGSS